MDYSTLAFLPAMSDTALWRVSGYFKTTTALQPKQFALFVCWMMPEMLEKFLHTAEFFSNVSMLVYTKRRCWCTVGLIEQPKFRSFVDLSYTAHFWLLLCMHALLLLRIFRLNFHASTLWFTRPNVFVAKIQTILTLSGATSSIWQIWCHWHA